jgi:acyl-CoA thioester hydrolase
MTHHLSVRVYYEDTDFAGIVYYANYLKFIERGRTEMLRAAGVDQSRLKAERGLVFVVSRVTIDYRAPARFDDLLTVETRIERLGRAALDMRQDVLREGDLLATALVRLACIGDDGRPVRLPADLAARLTG